MSSSRSSRGEVAASLARAARAPAVVLGRIALGRRQVVDAVVATSTGGAGFGRGELSAQITRTVGSLAARGALEPTPGPGTGAAVWMAQDRCLVGMWPDPPPIAPFVALIADRPEEATVAWRREIARVGLIYETERVRAGATEPVPAPAQEPDTLAEDILRLVAIGLVLCDRSGQVIYANAAAEQWTSGEGALELRQGRIAARRPDLRRSLEGALQAAAVGQPRRPTALALPRGGGDPVPDVVTVLPFAGAPCALMVFGGRDWDAGRGDLAMRAIGLTPAERRLVGHLCRGRTLDEAAGEADVTISTARTYLKRVFAKTGTHRQGELVALLASLSPPVAVRGPLDLEPVEEMPRLGPPGPIGSQRRAGPERGSRPGGPPPLVKHRI